MRKQIPHSPLKNCCIVLSILLFFSCSNNLIAQGTGVLQNPSVQDIETKTNLSKTVKKANQNLKLSFHPKSNHEQELNINNTKAVRVYVNGELVTYSNVTRRGVGNRQIPDVKRSDTWDFKLKEGDNEIRIGAITNTSDLDTTIHITYINPARQPALHFVGIGNSYIEQTNITSLNYAKNSTQTIQKAFQKQQGTLYKKGINDVFFDKKAQDIKDYIEKLAENPNISKNDMVVFYFANHANEKAIIFNESIFGTDTMLDKTINKSKLKSLIESFNCKTLLLLDICNGKHFLSNPVIESIEMEESKEPNPTDFFLKYPIAHLTIAAGRSNTYEVSNLKNSIFARAIEEMLKVNTADTSKDGHIDFGEMKAFLPKKINQLIQREGIKQPQKPVFTKSQGDLDKIPIFKMNN